MSSSFRDRLSMLDEHGNRRFIIPAEVRGKFQAWKKKTHFALLILFLILPWISIEGEQAVRLNIPDRQFHILGLHLFAHDAPLVFFVLFSFAMGLALATALFGRVWCGWACPQTVFIESVYRRIEIWTEGTYLQRRHLRMGPWNFERIRKVSVKWLLYTFVSMLIAHSFLAYWTGSRELLQMMGGRPSENQTYFLMVMGMTGLLLFNFGWFREQFCLIVCPYGKFQSVLMDSHSLTVMYDEKRGEPRKGSPQARLTSNRDSTQKGDCVSCQRCVQVCPTGIDIRNGVQMECIGCTACIDACDDIMAKVKKPPGLIRYKALTEKPIRWLRPRVIIYISLLVASLVGLIFSLAGGSNLRVEVFRSKDTLYQVRTNESGELVVQNQMRIRIENQKMETTDSFSMTTSRGDVRLIVPFSKMTLSRQEQKEIPIFVEARKDLLQQGYLSFDLQIKTEAGKVLWSKKDLKLIGPRE